MRSVFTGVGTALVTPFTASGALDEAAVRRAGRGDFRTVRVGDFVAFVGADETVVQRADPDWGWTEDDPGAGNDS